MAEGADVATSGNAGRFALRKRRHPSGVITQRLPTDSALDNPFLEGNTVTEPFPRQPTDVWVLTAVKTIRNGLGGDSLVPVDEANAWLNALKSATLDALHALDRINTVIVEATAGDQSRNALLERHGLAAVEKWSDDR